MKFFGRGDKGGAEVEWTPEQERELGEAAADMAGFMRGLKDPAASGMGQRLGAALERRATDRFLQVLDGVLQSRDIGRDRLPGEVAVEDFGTLSFGRQEGAIGIHLVLNSGKLVDRQSILAHDQRLWSGGEASSLAILLHGADGGPPVVASGPGVAGEGLEWTVPLAALLAGEGYRPRLECFADPSERTGYAPGASYGRAAGAGLGDGNPGPTPQEQGQEAEGPVVVFSRQEGEEGRLVVGIECKIGERQGLDFAAFERRLLKSLEGRTAFALVSRFPTSGRIYLALDAAVQEQVEEAVSQLNRDLSDKG